MLKNILLYISIFQTLFNSSPLLWATWDDPLQSSFLSLEKAQVTYNDFETNPYSSKKEKKTIRPYLLPWNHPKKPYLDAIFLNQRATMNPESFADAGFISHHIQFRSFIHVASHPLIPGYLVKVYLDSELRSRRNIPSWQWFANRAKNAKAIDNVIKSKKLKYFTVAKKWIYPLPINPAPPNDLGYLRKNVILLVKDMNLVSKSENLLAWKTVITKKHLDEFYTIITSVGGSSYRPDNVTYTKNGKFAFIDTEYTNKSPDYRSILPYLSPKMAAYWKKLIK